MSNELTYPLQWPIYRVRAQAREISKFKPHSLSNAYLTLLDELRLMGVDDPVITTNVRLRVDGSPVLNQGGPIDPGVAIYFDFDTRPVVLCCDQWNTVADNVWAIAKTVEAMRGIDRWGATNLTDTFTGYLAIAAPVAEKPWWEVLHVHDAATVDQIRDSFRRLAKEYHPDAGGSQDQFVELQGAYARAMKARGL